MKKIGNIFILLGAALLIFIIFAKGKTYFEQKKLTEEYTSLSFSEETIEEQPEQPSIKNGDPIGILEIPAIDLTTPMVEGSEPENIKFAVGHLPSSSTVNDLGKKNQNFAIAGHRSYTYGKFFNRLDELAAGDTITVNTQHKVFTYKVIEKKIVKPTNVEVILPIKGKSIVTLITCHPKNSDKQRLIVYCELLSQKEKKENEV